ncbi:MAG TPA: hypothetical protein VNR18_13445, partial [Hyphomicrobiales bacterium]|nr:hypothetical protein [Hyphomicrobiales bacterium]
MNTPPSDSDPAPPPAASGVASDLRGALYRQLLASSTGVLWAVPVAVLLICSILRQSLPPLILGTWALAALTHGLLVYLNYGRAHPDVAFKDIQPRHQVYFVALGIIWGGLPLLNALWGSATGVWLALMVNMGTMAVLTFLLGTSERYFLISFLPLAALMTLGIALSTLPRPALMLLSLLYAWLMWRMHKLFHAVHRERIQASLRNLEQAAALSRSLELRDSLTGLLNKAGLKHWLDSEQRHYPADRPVLFTLGSVLGFGEINSLY